MSYKELLQERQRTVAEAKRRMPTLTFEELVEQAERLENGSPNKDNRKMKQPITDEEIQRILNDTYGCDSI